MRKNLKLVTKLILMFVVLSIVLMFQLFFGCQHVELAYDKARCKKKIYMPGELIANDGFNIQFKTIYSFEQYDQPSKFYPRTLLNFEVNRLTNDMDQIAYTAFVGLNTSETGGIQIDKTLYTPGITPGSALEQLIMERKALYPNTTGFFYEERFTDAAETAFICRERVTIHNTTTGGNVAYFDGDIDCNNGYRKWYEQSFDKNFNNIALVSSYQCNSCFSTDKITGADVLLVLVGTITLYNTVFAILDKIKDTKMFKKSKATDESSQGCLNNDEDVEGSPLRDSTDKNEYVELESSIKESNYR